LCPHFKFTLHFPPRLHSQQSPVPISPVTFATPSISFLSISLKVLYIKLSLAVESDVSSFESFMLTHLLFAVNTFFCPRIALISAVLAAHRLSECATPALRTAVLFAVGLGNKCMMTVWTGALPNAKREFAFIISPCPFSFCFPGSVTISGHPSRGPGNNQLFLCDISAFFATTSRFVWPIRRPALHTALVLLAPRHRVTL
jgi:hypothetical protein